MHLISRRLSSNLQEMPHPVRWSELHIGAQRHEINCNSGQWACPSHKELDSSIQNAYLGHMNSFNQRQDWGIKKKRSIFYFPSTQILINTVFKMEMKNTEAN